MQWIHQPNIVCFNQGSVKNPPDFSCIISHWTCWNTLHLRTSLKMPRIRRLRPASEAPAADWVSALLFTGNGPSMAPSAVQGWFHTVPNTRLCNTPQTWLTDSEVKDETQWFFIKLLTGKTGRSGKVVKSSPRPTIAQHITPWSPFFHLLKH